jgi:DNA primase
MDGNEFLMAIQHMTAGMYRCVSANVAGRGAEWCGPCPQCAGHDRFRIWPDHPKGAQAWCRQCNHVMFADNTRAHGILADSTRADEQGSNALAHQIPVYQPDPCKPPSTDWQDYYESRLPDWLEALWGEYAKPREYLMKRGIIENTLHDYGIGYNPADIHDAVYGHIPRGIIIPWYIDCVLWRVVIRTPHNGPSKYINAQGSGNALYNADLLGAKPAIIVEGCFDALAIMQEARDLVTPVASGTTGARRTRWYARFANSPSILVGLDNDEPGEKASGHWISIFEGRSMRWRPVLNDPAEMLEKGISIREWITCALETSMGSD